MIEKMTPAFRKAEGGLFGEVMKADVGDAVSALKEGGVQLMSWADPFYSGYNNLSSTLHQPPVSSLVLEHCITNGHILSKTLSQAPYSHANFYLSSSRLPVFCLQQNFNTGGT